MLKLWIIVQLVLFKSTGPMIQSLQKQLRKSSALSKYDISRLWQIDVVLVYEEEKFHFQSNKKNLKSPKNYNPETVRLQSLSQSELNHWQTDLPTLQSVLMPSLLLIPHRHWLMQINTYSHRRCSFSSRISGMSGSSLNIMTLKDLCEVNKTHAQ